MARAIESLYAQVKAGGESHRKFICPIKSWWREFIGTVKSRWQDPHKCLNVLVKSRWQEPQTIIKG